MRSRHILGAAILCGALSTLGGQSVQAETPDSARFVQLLLLNQSAQITAETKALNTRNREIAKLESASSARQGKSLGKTLSRLNAQILSMTAKLVLLSTETYNTAVNLSSPNRTTLVSQSLAGLLAVQNLSLQTGLGISPATPH